MLLSMSLTCMKYFPQLVTHKVPLSPLYLFVTFTMSPFLKLFATVLFHFSVRSFISLFYPSMTRFRRFAASSSSPSVTFNNFLLTLSTSPVFFIHLILSLMLNFNSISSTLSNASSKLFPWWYSQNDQ